LLALNSETGKKEWIQDYNKGRSGFYNLFGNKIYKHDGNSLIEIEAKTGEKLREMEFQEYTLNNCKTFYALHHFWVYEDIIVMYGYNNMIVLINRQDFVIKDYIQLPNALSASKDNVIWHNHKLYVLDLTNTLHIFEED
jgi:hypothetical protein